MATKRLKWDLGKPKNDIDKRMLKQMLSLVGKHVVVQYGVHLGENPGRLAAMLARKRLEKLKPEEKRKIGFLEFQGVFDVHRDALIKVRAKGIAKKPTKTHFMKAEEQLIKENIIPSDNFDRDSLEGCVRAYVRPYDYIDVHATPKEIMGHPQSSEPFVIDTTSINHFNVMENLLEDADATVSDEVLDAAVSGLTNQYDLMPHTWIEVVGKARKVRARKRMYGGTPSELAEKVYRILPAQYKGTLVDFDEGGTVNSRKAANFLVKFVKKLIRTRTSMRRPRQ